MMSVANYLSSLVQMTDQKEEYILAQALEIGLRQLWREEVLARYLRGELSREEAIEQVGITWVALADEQAEAVLEDIHWALTT
ncbi:MAG TPA: hypothetical protein ENK60_04520 [Anaerolineae bacterium]|nr:hypothetical protein [Anaerolineae bacterium]